VPKVHKGVTVGGKSVPGCSALLRGELREIGCDKGLSFLYYLR